MAPKRGTQYYFGLKDLQEIKALFKILGPPFWVPFFGPHFGGQILAPFLGPFFNLHFGPKMVQNLQKFLRSKLHSKTFSSKQILHIKMHL